MLISIDHLAKIFDVRPRGVLHVGAHDGEEAVNYGKYGWGPVTWVEMLPDKYEGLKKRFMDDPGHTVINAACWDSDGVDLPVFRASNGESSSLLKPTEHLVSHPKVTFELGSNMQTSRLDSILPPNAQFDYLSLDIQGAELRALRGLGKHLSNIRWACIEVNTRRLYQDCALLDELDNYLREWGFERLIIKMAGSKGWGDGFYVNKNLIPSIEYQRLRRSARSWRIANFIREVPKKFRLRSLLRMLN